MTITHAAPRGNPSRPYPLRRAPGRRMLRLLITAAVSAALFLCGPAIYAQQGRTEHGSLDRFEADGVTLAWAILKAAAGISPDNDLIVLRLAVKGTAAPAAEVHGVDPFGGERKTMSASPGPGNTLELRLPRSHFADFPRTEILVFETQDALRSGRAPVLTVYYLGIPDTTPEFLDRDRMEAYIAERIGG